MKFLLVGTQFSPGATALITKGLAQRAQVTLRAEPENPYDSLAVRVFVPRESVLTSPDLDEALAAFGLTYATLEWPFALGHLGATQVTKAAKAALREGHQFSVVSEWHQLPEAARSSGRLIQHGNGTNLIELGERNVGAPQ